MKSVQVGSGIGCGLCEGLLAEGIGGLTGTFLTVQLNEGGSLASATLVGGAAELEKLQLSHYGPRPSVVFADS